MADPALAYLKGLQDGYQMGWGRGHADLDAAVAWALSAGATTNAAEAVAIHQRFVAAATARAEADAVRHDKDMRAVGARDEMERAWQAAHVERS